MFQNKENQGDTVEYTHVKDEAVKFHCTQNTDSFHTPRIQIISRGSVQILSFRLNKTECPWHWEGDWIIPDTEDENVKELFNEYVRRWHETKENVQKINGPLYLASTADSQNLNWDWQKKWPFEGKMN